MEEPAALQSGPEIHTLYHAQLRNRMQLTWLNILPDTAIGAATAARLRGIVVATSNLQSI